MKTRRSVILYYRHNFQEKKSKILHVTFFNVCVNFRCICLFTSIMKISFQIRICFRESFFLTDLPQLHSFL